MFSLLSFWRIDELRGKILFTFLLLGISRLAAHAPLPGVNLETLRSFFAQNQILNLLSLLSGGSLANFSLTTLGLNPYINASIILQLFTMVLPRLEELSKEGEAGRAKINQYTRLLTIPLALLSAFGTYLFLQKQGLLETGSVQDMIVGVVSMTTGTIFLMWLGELISEYGIGNGISVLIFAGIIASLPVLFEQTRLSFQSEEAFVLLLGLLLGALLIWGIVMVNEASRRVRVEYARRMAGGRSSGGFSHLPLRLNQAGVIPIIFAVSLVFLPSVLGTYLSGSPLPELSRLGNFLLSALSPSSVPYIASYFLLVVLFTFFYTTVTFNPEKIAGELKKYGGFIPGIRPGRATADYLSYLLTRLTLWGALFLGAVAVLPSLSRPALGAEGILFALGGTGVLIIVSVVLESLKQIEAQIGQRSYERFL